jgi:hypothetical protein
MNIIVDRIAILLKTSSAFLDFLNKLDNEELHILEEYIEYELSAVQQYSYDEGYDNGYDNGFLEGQEK